MPSHRPPRRFIPVPPSAPPGARNAAADRADPASSIAGDGIRDLERSVRAVVDAADGVLAGPAARPLQDHGLRQLDERLAGEPADFDDAAFEPLESLEKALDDMFTVRPANAVPAEVAPTGPVPRQRTAELSPRRPQSRPGFERRVQQGTRFDRACPHGEPRPPLSRSERAAEFARAMREGPASDTSLPEANSSDSGTTDSFSRLLAVAGAISFIHAILTAMSWPLRFVPPRRRVWVNWLAIALAFWTPIVWLVTLFISG